MNFEVTELLKFWTERIVETDQTERERPSLGLLLEKMLEVIREPCSDKILELRLGGEDNALSTNLGTIGKGLRPSWRPHPRASLNEVVTERVKDEWSNEGPGSGELT